MVRVHCEDIAAGTISWVVYASFVLQFLLMALKFDGLLETTYLICLTPSMVYVSIALLATIAGVVGSWPLDRDDTLGLGGAFVFVCASAWFVVGLGLYMDGVLDSLLWPFMPLMILVAIGILFFTWLIWTEESACMGVLAFFGGWFAAGMYSLPALFICFKLTGIIDWRWAVVFIPLWIPDAGLTLFGVLSLLFITCVPGNSWEERGWMLLALLGGIVVYGPFLAVKLLIVLRLDAQLWDITAMWIVSPLLIQLGIGLVGILGMLLLAFWGWQGERTRRVRRFLGARLAALEERRAWLMSRLAAAAEEAAAQQRVRSHLQQFVADEQLADCVVLAEERPVPAHRVILAARLKDYAGEAEVALDGVSYETAIDLLYFIYTGRPSEDAASSVERREALLAAGRAWLQPSAVAYLEEDAALLEDAVQAAVERRKADLRAFYREEQYDDLLAMLTEDNDRLRGSVAEGLADARPLPVALLRDAVGDEAMSDVTLIVEGKPLHAHRLLAMQSAYLHGLLGGGMAEAEAVGRGEAVELHDVSYDAMHAVLGYLYSGSLSAEAKSDLQTMLDVLQLADFLGAGSVVGACQLALAQQVALDTVLPVLEYAEGLHAEALKEYCIDFCAANFDSVHGQEGYADLPPEVKNEIWRVRRLHRAALQLRIGNSMRSLRYVHVDVLKKREQGVFWNMVLSCCCCWVITRILPGGEPRPREEDLIAVRAEREELEAVVVEG